MAGEIGNPLGYIALFDGENPRTVQGLTEAVVSGGAPVYASGAAGNVGSQTSSYITEDVIFLTNASGLLYNGVATQTVGSNAIVTVATRGIIIGKAAGTVTAGTAVEAQAGGFLNVGSKAAGGQGFTSSTRCGRAFSSATSGNYALIDLQG